MAAAIALTGCASGTPDIAPDIYPYGLYFRSCDPNGENALLNEFVNRYRQGSAFRTIWNELAEAGAIWRKGLEFAEDGRVFTARFRVFNMFRYNRIWDIRVTVAEEEQTIQHLEVSCMFYPLGILR